MAPPPGKLEFNEITLIYRNESKGGEPTEVRRDFYPAFREYLKRLKTDSEDEVRKDPTSMKASSMMSEIKKVTQKGSSIFQYRMSKIMSMALRAGMGSKVDIDQAHSGGEGLLRCRGGGGGGVQILCLGGGEAIHQTFRASLSMHRPGPGEVGGRIEREACHIP